MGDLNMVRVASRAAAIAGDANAAYWVQDGATIRHLTGTIHDQFCQLADALGYRVERIGDGINTGKPVVAGGV
jgi:hypothetical protein